MPSLNETILNCEINSINISSVQAQNIHFYGGSEEGQFVFIEKISDDLLYRNKSLQDNILIKIEETPISGYRLKDVKDLLSALQKTHDIIHMKLVHNGNNFPRDLRTYLGLRFGKESPEHELQQIIRENLYLRTVPCTTRAPRAGEIDGVDYCFVSLETFCHLQKTDQLIEFGVFEGNLYGTPRPSCSLEDTSEGGGSATPSPSPPSSFGRGVGGEQLIGGVDSGISSVTTDDVDVTVPHQPSQSASLKVSSLNAVVVVTTSYTPPPISLRGAGPPSGGGGHYEPVTVGHTPTPSPPSSFARLPKSSEQMVKQNGYHRDGRIQKSQSTPAFVAIPREPDVSEGVLNLSLNSENLSTKRPSEIRFCKNPLDLSQRLLGFHLCKGDTGFGFTILGSSERDKDFLYVNQIFSNSPASVDGNLQRGDILVYVDDACVLGYSHSDILDMFRSIPIASVVQLIVCRSGHDSSTASPPPSADRKAAAVCQRPRDRPPNLPIPSKNGETSAQSNISHLNSHTPVKYPYQAPRLHTSNPTNGGNGYSKEFQHLQYGQQLTKHETRFTSIPSLNNPSARCEQDPNWPTSVQDLILDLPLYHTLDGSPVEEHLGLAGGAEMDGSCIKITRNYCCYNAPTHRPLLHSGDVILSLEGMSVLKAAKFQALHLLQKARSAGKLYVKMGIRRVVVPQDTASHLNGNSRQNGMEAELTIFACTLQRSSLNEGFGFIILSALDGRSGSYINKIIPDSPADKCSALRVGQRILAVNGIDVSSLSSSQSAAATTKDDNYHSEPDPLSLVHGQIVELVKRSGLTLHLILAQPNTTTTPDTTQANGVCKDGCLSSPLYEEKSETVGEMGNGVECEYVGVELFKGTRGFGFSIRGGTEFQRMPLYVYRIAEGGPASRDGRIKVGDEIVEINGVKAGNLTHNEALELMKSGEHVVRLMIKRRIPQNPFDL